MDWAADLYTVTSDCCGSRVESISNSTLANQPAKCYAGYKSRMFFILRYLDAKCANDTTNYKNTNTSIELGVRVWLIYNTRRR